MKRLIERTAQNQRQGNRENHDQGPIALREQLELKHLGFSLSRLSCRSVKDEPVWSKPEAPWAVSVVGSDPFAKR
jgi:hypothetical protein